jgi:hypothetical protein
MSEHGRVNTKESIMKKKTLPEKKSAEPQKLVKAVQTGDKHISVHMVADPYPQTGCRTQEGAGAIIEACVNTFRNAETALAVKDVNDHLALMAELKPKDAFEGLLVSQMLMVHKQAMDMISMSNLPGNRSSSSLQDGLTNRAVKLMRLYAQQLEALDKHRRGGKQKMVVEHVTVNEGGQAIVGSVNQGGGGKDEK